MKFPLATGLLALWFVGISRADNASSSAAPSAPPVKAVTASATSTTPSAPAKVADQPAHSAVPPSARSSAPETHSGANPHSPGQSAPSSDQVAKNEPSPAVDGDTQQAAQEAREQLADAQRMADAAEARAAASSYGTTSPYGTSSSNIEYVPSDSQSESATYYPSASTISSGYGSSTHHTIGERESFSLRPDYSDPHHHSMNELVP